MTQLVRNSFEFITLEERVADLERKLDDLAFNFDLIGDDSFRWDLVGFGYKIVGTTVTIYSGEIQVGTSVPLVTSNTNKIITADNQYIAVELRWDLFQITIGSPTTVKPVSTNSHFRKWLYKFRLINGLVSISEIGNIGNIHIPSVYGG